jgi:hypothetical protein
MDFIGKYNLWYCPICGKYNPQIESQNSHQLQSPNVGRKTMILTAIIVVIIIIFAVIGVILSTREEISIKVVNNTNHELKIYVSFEDYWFTRREIDINDSITFSDTRHQKGTDHSLEFICWSPEGQAFSEDINVNKDVTFTVQEYYEIEVTYD